ncbi:MAG TPA: N-acetyltransferase [Caulobacterales bacterium]|nr:N-acetyltransferase [Caulobacterales bacterium]
MSYHLVSERPEHASGVAAMLDRAFGPGRFAKTSERVRERGAVFEPSLSRVAVDDDGAVLGCCRIWRVRVGEAGLYFLGPLAVDPDAQHHGLGAALTRDALTACRIVGGAGVLLVGAAAFFRPLGFSVAPAGRVTLPGPVDPARLLWIELRPGGLDKVAGAVAAP